MKKIYSIFFATLIIYLCVINISSAYAKTQSSSISTNNNSTVDVFNYATQQLYITQDDIDLMAKLVAAESIGEPYTGKVAVASVVLNRVSNPKFPNSIQGVIFQKNAFSCVRNNQILSTPNEDCYRAVYEAINGSDPTNKALFFYNPAIATCNWMKQSNKVNETIIGHHTFFKIE